MYWLGGCCDAPWRSKCRHNTILRSVDNKMKKKLEPAVSWTHDPTSLQRHMQETKNNIQILNIFIFVSATGYLHIGVRIPEARKTYSMLLLRVVVDVETAPCAVPNRRSVNNINDCSLVAAMQLSDIVAMDTTTPSSVGHPFSTQLE